MNTALFQKSVEVILQGAAKKGITTARRLALLQILWNERFLTRKQLMSLVEAKLGGTCFSAPARNDIFHKDMRVVKQAFHEAGFVLEYSRNRERRGYYLRGQPVLSPEFRQMVKASVAEVDQRQIDIYNRLSKAALFHQGCAISDAARNVVAYRIQQENPDLTLLEANRMALQRAYSS